VAEPVRGLARDERLRREDELAADERLQRGRRLPERGLERGEAADVEQLAFGGTGLEQPSLGCAQRVEARGEQGVERRRERSRRAALADVRGELLEEQRVAARLGDDAAELRLRQSGSRREEPAGGPVVERRQ
jgi:hypothetical protein